MNVLCTNECSCKGKCFKLPLTTTNKPNKKICRCKTQCGGRSGCKKKNLTCNEHCTCKKGYYYNNICDKVDRMLGIKQGKNSNYDESADLSVMLGLVPAKIITKKSDISQLTCSETTNNIDENNKTDETVI